jgi:hypothetical protein
MMEERRFTGFKRKICELLNKPFLIKELTLMDIAAALFAICFGIIFRDSVIGGFIGGILLFCYGYIKHSKLQKDAQAEEIKNKKHSVGVCEEIKDVFKEMGFISEQESDNNLVILEEGDIASSDGLEFIKELVSNMIEQMMDRVYILDGGINFENQAKKYGKKYISLVKNKNISINVFSLINGVSESIEEDNLMMLTLLIEMMLLSEKTGKQKEGELNRDLIKEGVKAIWKEKKDKAGISDLIKWMAEIKCEFSKDARYIASMLFRYDDKGEYGKYFNGSANLDISGKWSAVGFEGIEEKIRKVLVAGVLVNIYLKDKQTGEKCHKAIVLRDLIGDFKSKTDKEFINKYWGVQMKEKKEIIININPDDEILADMVGERVCCLSYDKKSIRRLAKLGEDKFLLGKNIWTQICKEIKEESQCIDEHPEYILTSIVDEIVDNNKRRGVGVYRRRVDYATVKEASIL